MNKLPRANKTLGQHFLRDRKVISKITQDAVQRNLLAGMDGILEIGPGPGILTEFLAQHGLPLQVVEKDDRFPEHLSAWLRPEQIIMGDALEVDLSACLNSKQQEKVWLVSNLPYNISVPLLMRFMVMPELKLLTLMFQREVADKIFPFDTAPTKAMNSLLALAQTYFKVELLCQVPGGCFTPPPKVGSTVLSFIRHPEPTIPLDQFKKFEKFLRNLFQFKRKQMGKVLKSQHGPEAIEQALKNLQLPGTLRAEALNLMQIQQLYRELCP